MQESKREISKIRAFFKMTSAWFYYHTRHTRKQKDLTPYHLFFVVKSIPLLSSPASVKFRTTVLFERNFYVKYKSIFLLVAYISSARAMSKTSFGFCIFQEKTLIFQVTATMTFDACDLAFVDKQPRDVLSVYLCVYHLMVFVHKQAVNLIFFREQSVFFLNRKMTAKMKQQCNLIIILLHKMISSQ